MYFVTRCISYKIGLAFLILNLSSCRYMVKVDDPLLITNYLSKIEAHNSQVRQLKASLDIKHAGFIGSFFHEEADIVAQAPDRLYWSLRSFLGPPILVIASNGQFITVYDFSGQSPTTYQKFDLEEESFFDLLGFKFHPQSLIYLLMSQIPLGLNMEFKALGDRLEISADLKDGWQVIALFDTVLLRVIKTRLINKQEGISFKAAYGDFVQASGIDFPSSLVLQIKGKSQLADFDIHLSNIDLNSDPVSLKAFFLEPH